MLRLYFITYIPEKIQSQTMLGDRQQIEKEKIHFWSPCNIKNQKCPVTFTKRFTYYIQYLLAFS